MRYRLNGYKLKKVNEAIPALVTETNPENYIELTDDLYAVIHRIITHEDPVACDEPGEDSKIDFSSKHVKDVLGLFLKTGLLIDNTQQEEEEISRDRVEKSSNDLVLSILLLDYNHVEDTVRCIDSILASTYRHFEIIVVENGSTKENARKMKERYKDEASVKIIRSYRNLGFSGGNNLGIKHATGDIFFILNNDTVLKRDVLEIIANFHAAHPGKMSIPKLYLGAFPQYLNAIGNSIFVDDWGCDNAIGHLDVNQFDKVKNVVSANFAAIAIPREIYRDVGNLDHKVYFMYYEDVDWCFRAFMKNYEIHVLHDAKVYHDFCATTRTWKKKWAWVLQGRISFAIRFFRKEVLLHALKSYFILDYRAFIGSKKLRDYATCYYYMKGYLRVIMLLPRLLITRIRFMKEKNRHGVDEMDFLKTKFPPPLLKEHGPYMNREVIDDLLNKSNRLKET